MKSNEVVKEYSLQDFLEMALSLDEQTLTKLYYMMQGATLLSK